MDTISVPQTALRLGTTPPRVWRALDHLGIEPAKGRRGHFLDPEEFEQIRRHLGNVPDVAGLDRESLLALAALNRRPFGVRSARALARSAGISPTTASRVLAELTDQGLVERTEPTLAEGSARKTVVFTIKRDNPRWAQIVEDLKAVDVPSRGVTIPTSRAKRVPTRLRHHFWNATPANLKLPEQADFVAARLLRTNDPEAVAWAALNLPVESILKVSDLRGLSPRERGWLRNMAALTVHLRHRISRDLDFLLEKPEDLDQLRARISGAGSFAVTYQDEATLNGVFDDTKIQVLGGTGQNLLAPTTDVGGLRVASVRDITAMKIKVIVDRGEMRDYYDLMEIDRRRIVEVEEGLALFLQRYHPPNPDEYVVTVIRALGYLGDVADDPALPASRAEIESYWMKRQPALLRNVQRW